MRDYAVTDYGEVVSITTSQCEDGLFVARTEDYGITACVGKGYHEVGIWLPIGFNPDTGNWQIDDLLMEISGKTYGANAGMIRSLFLVWLKVKTKTDLTGSEGIYMENDLILKLMWLRELIEEASK